MIQKIKLVSVVPKDDFSRVWLTKIYLNAQSWEPNFHFILGEIEKYIVLWKDTAEAGNKSNKLSSECNKS